MSEKLTPVLRNRHPHTVAKAVRVRFLLPTVGASLEPSRQSLQESFTAVDPVLADSTSDTGSEPLLRFLLLYQERHISLILLAVSKLH